MKLLKHINNNLFLIDTEAEIKENDYYIYPTVKPKGYSIDRYSDMAGIENEISLGNLKAIKIIAQLNPEFKDIPLMQLPVKPQVDMEKLLQKKYPYGSGNCLEKREVYRQALSDNAGKVYTKEDIIKVLTSWLFNKQVKLSSESLSEFIDKALQQPNLQELDGKEVEIKMEKVVNMKFNPHREDDTYNPMYFKQEILSAEGKIQIKIL